MARSGRMKTKTIKASMTDDDGNLYELVHRWIIDDGEGGYDYGGDWYSVNGELRTHAICTAPRTQEEVDELVRTYPRFQKMLNESFEEMFDDDL